MLVADTAIRLRTWKMFEEKKMKEIQRRKKTCWGDPRARGQKRCYKIISKRSLGTERNLSVLGER